MADIYTVMGISHLLIDRDNLPRAKCMISERSQAPEAEIFERRRSKLFKALPSVTMVLHNGLPQYRTVLSISSPFRPSSHVIFLFGILPPGAIAVLHKEESYLFLEPPTEATAVWEGHQENFAEIARRTGATHVQALDCLPALLGRIDTQGIQMLPWLSVETSLHLSRLLGRSPDIAGADADLARAIVEQRLCHDAFGCEQLRQAGKATAQALRRGMAYTQPGLKEYQVQAEIESECVRSGMGLSFTSIVSVHGEVLHNTHYDGVLAESDLLLADIGAETRDGYAGDCTRTWPVSARLSPMQRDIYQLVLAAQSGALALCKPGISFRDVHLAACRVFAEGLITMGVLTGTPQSLVERGAHALFFVHGIGHLLGLDVHDMEDLGDLAGYAAGRSRSQQFGLNFLRLDRDLVSGMAVTIEPGFYCIPALLESAERREQFKDCLVIDRLEQLADVRGIRIEDSVLITNDGHEVLTADVPKSVDEIEALVGERRSCG